MREEAEAEEHERQAKEGQEQKEEEYANSAEQGAGQKKTGLEHGLIFDHENRKQEEKGGTEFYPETWNKATGMEDCPWLKEKIATCDAATDTQDFTEWRLKEGSSCENMLGSFQREQQMSAIEAGRVGDEQGRIGSS